MQALVLDREVSSDKGISACVHRITPALAAEWLQNNTKNRPITHGMILCLTPRNPVISLIAVRSFTSA